MSLNPANYKLSPELLDAMIQNEVQLKYKRDENVFDKQGIKGPADIVRDKLASLDLALSEPLKKLHSRWLTRCAKNCYQEKHISDEWTNLEQINHCREVQKDKVLGDFNANTHSRRTRDAYKFQTCIHDSKEQISKITQ